MDTHLESPSGAKVSSAAPRGQVQNRSATLSALVPAKAQARLRKEANPRRPWWSCRPLRERLLNLALVLSSGLAGFLLLERARTQLEIYEREEEFRAVLRTVHRRQTLIKQQTDRYAGSLEVLQMKLRPEIAAALTLVVIDRPRRSTFLAELCDRSQCMSVGPSGKILTGVRMRQPTANEDLALPVLRASTSPIVLPVPEAGPEPGRDLP